jgi:hypothetical protein
MTGTLPGLFIAFGAKRLRLNEAQETLRGRGTASRTVLSNRTTKVTPKPFNLGGWSKKLHALREGTQWRSTFATYPNFLSDGFAQENGLRWGSGPSNNLAANPISYIR